MTGAPGKPLNRQVRGIRDTIPTGTLLGRTDAGDGPVQLLPLSLLKAKLLGGTASGGGGLTPIADKTFLANTSGGVANPVATTLNTFFDDVLGAAEGDLIYRNATGWVVLAPGTSGFYLKTQGAAADPLWAVVNQLPSIADGDLLANTSGSGALPVATTLTHLIDYAIGSTQGDLLYRNASGWVVLAPGTAGQVLSTQGAGANPQWVAASAVTTAVDLNMDNIYFGNGDDGDVTISVNTALTRDMYYHNLTINSGVQLNVAGFRVFVSGTLDLTNASANAIVNQSSGTNPQNGGDSATTAGGSPGLSVARGTLGGNATSGATGSAGGTTTGTAGVAGTNGSNDYGGGVGASGKGGNGPSGNGGAASPARSTPTLSAAINRLQIEFTLIGASSTITNLAGGIGGSGGGGGGGDGVGTGGGGGGGGAGGPVLFVAARTIARASGTTAALAINARGGAAGKGGPGSGGTNRGGGGGGNGGGGGWLYIIYRLLTGSAVTNLVAAMGGNGGNGGNGLGTGIGGNGGDAGAGGRIDIYCLADGSHTLQAIQATGSAPAGTAGSGVTGGTGATATTWALTL